MGTRTRHRIFLGAALCAVIGCDDTHVDTRVPAVFRVDADAPGPAHDGTSWATAFLHPQDAVDVSIAGDEIWVAEGTYTQRDPAAYFLVILEEGIAIYGGFAGTESARYERDSALHETILDGENRWGNVRGASNCRLDGFVLTRGYASSPMMVGSGGGMCNFLGLERLSGLTVANCTFAANGAEYHGGAMHNRNSSVAVVNCVFVGDKARHGGGAMWNQDSSVTVTNCTFSGNSAPDYGGCFYNTHGSTVPVTNCVMWGDTASQGKEIYNDGTSSCTVAYSCVDQVGGFTDGGGNVNADPLFLATGYLDDNGTPSIGIDDFWVDGDYRLRAGSPCIDSADGDAAPAADIEGLFRRDDSGTPDTGAGAVTYADMGAHEF